MMDLLDYFTKPFLDDVPKDTDKIQKNYNNNQITEIFVEDNKVFNEKYEDYDVLRSKYN